MRFHWQNLNDAKPTPRWGGGYRHGRAWLNFSGDYDGRRGLAVSWRWALLWDASCAVSLSLVRQEGTGVSFRVALPRLFDFYLTLKGGPFAWLALKLLPSLHKDQRLMYPGADMPRKDYGDRELFNLYFYGWAFWWNFWRDPMGGWSSRDPKWQHGSFDFLDFVFGKTKHESRELASEQVLIPMPERAYDATVVIEERVWRRPRWPFAWHRLLGADVKMDRDPIPFPGKGESAHDCGEDATYSSSFPCPTGLVEDAIAHVVQSSLHSRRRHGGSVLWAPKEDHRPKPKPGGSAPPESADAVAVS